MGPADGGEDWLGPLARHIDQVALVEPRPDLALLLGGHLRGSRSDRYGCRMLIGLFSHQTDQMPSVGRLALRRAGRSRPPYFQGNVPARDALATRDLADRVR